MEEKEYQDLLEKYKAKVKEEFGGVSKKPTKVSSKEYTEFKKELYPTNFSLYEKACNFSEKILKIKADPKKSIRTQKNIEACHLNITPSGIISFSLLGTISSIVIGSIIAFMLPLFFGLAPEPNLLLFSLFGSLGVFFILQKTVDFMANSWRMKASNQMVQSIFYIVTYMRHTSNLERAIEFAADHLQPPLSLDFRKILWDVETQKYSSIRESAESYLEKWKEYDKNFVEAFHLIESSLFESSEERRLSLLDKSLDVILNGTYENMLHYAHELKAPMTMLHMLGIILPILGLVILPLIVSFMGGDSSPFMIAIYISLIYNVTLPTSVFYLGKNILSKRPAGYGATDISEQKGFKNLKNVNIPMGKAFNISINPIVFSLVIFVVAIFIGLSPLILNSLGSNDFELVPGSGLMIMDYVCPTCKPAQSGNVCGPSCEDEYKIGPFGVGASILSLIIIVGLGFSTGLFYKLRSTNVIKIRRKTKELEDEFSSALFQLGNRLGDGIPAEIAFAKVSATMQGSTSGDFFNLVEKNITKLGMGLEQAIFDPKVGSIASFPSKVIESSMKVLVESIKKGPRIAAQALLSMSRYIKEIHRVEERLKDLMADVIASMKSQIKFLTPAISGIVIGITSMISTILNTLNSTLADIGGGSETAQLGGMSQFFGSGLPTYYFQIIVGVYIVQIVYILTVLSNGIENGADKLGERYELGKNLIRSTLSYCIIAGIVILLFNVLASGILEGLIK